MLHNDCHQAHHGARASVVARRAMTMRRSPGGLVATTLAAIAVFGLGRFSAPSSVSSDVSGRLYLKVSFDVKPERRGDFLAAIRANEKGTNKEPLNRAYLWGEDTETPNRFHFHEEYQGSAGFEAHLASAHVAAWDRTRPRWSWKLWVLKGRTPIPVL